MDEIGSSLVHSDEPNMAIVPFFFLKPEGISTYNVIWPLQDIEEDDTLTCNRCLAGMR
jgi:hypothetical protein